MNKFKNLKIRSKLLLSFAVMALVAAVLGVTGLVSTMTFGSMITEMKELQHESNSISTILNAHYTWRQDLTESVLTGREFHGSLDSQTCALGKWYSSEAASNMNDPKLLDMLESILEPHAFIHNEANNVMALVHAGHMDEAREYFESVVFPKTEEVITILTGMQSYYSDIVELRETESAATTAKMQVVDVVLIVAALGICAFLALFIPGLISKPLVLLTAFLQKAGTTGDIALTESCEEFIGKYSKYKDETGLCITGAAAFIKHVANISEELESIARGDLTIDIDLLSENDVMGKSLTQMVDSLSAMFNEINDATTQVSLGSKQIADGAQSLAQGSTEQAASIEQLSSSISEIALKTKANAETAEKTALLAEAIISNAEKGSRHMDEMMSAVQEINQANRSISKVIKVIDDIAFQTNILALNAAVEAARAGQHGKGFAVVAEEVRNLASKSAKAAKETSSMIEDSMEKAETGTRIAGETAASLTEIVDGINESNGYIKEIAAASEEQSQGISQINTGIDQVSQVVYLNSATAQESAATSEEMSGQSAALKKLVEQFKTKKDALPGRTSSEEGYDIVSLAMPAKSNYMLPSASGAYGKY